MDEQVDFKSGDVVTLKSGGPKMTLCWKNKTDPVPVWTVAWFSGDNLKHEKIAEVLLKLADV